MEIFLLRILDLFQVFFRIIHVNYKQLRAIVSIKLKMDNRRQLVAYSRKENPEPTHAFIGTLLIYTLFGGFVAVAIYTLPFTISMIVFFSYIMVMIIMTLITDFSSVLLDTSDNTIILPRPLDSRTLYAARLTHITLYLGQLAFGLSLISLIVVIVKYGLFFSILFSIGVIIVIVTSLFITNSLYLIIMQFFSEEKLKNVINYFQIGMAVFVVGGYQLISRIVGQLDIKSYVFEIQWWSYLVPSIWIAAGLESIHENIFDVPHILLLTLALVIPVMGIYLVNQYLTPVFTSKLGSMTSHVEQPEKNLKAEQVNLITRISGWVTTSGAERGAFEIIYKILGRDRKIKLKVYPAFGYIFVFGLIFMLQGKQNLITTFNELPTTQYHLVLIYLTFLVLQVACDTIPYTDDFKASWIYFAVPLNKPGEILSGTIKAIFFRLFIPGYSIICIFVLSIWGLQAADDLLFGLFNNFLMLMVFVSIGKRHLPLSMPASLKSQTGNFARGMLMIIVIGVLGLGHYALTNLPFDLIGMIPIQLVAIYLAHQHYKKTSWNKISLLN